MTNEKIEKALDLACEELVDTYSQFEDETKIYFKNGKVKYACNMTKEDWKEYLLSEIE